MQKIYTHYDNLRVSRNAPLEVIRAAYKTLSQKYHPDRNLGNPDASRIMTIINSSYDVLSDPGKRAEHDAWIAEQESSTTEQKTPPCQNAEAAQTSQVATTTIAFKTIMSHVLRYWGALYYIFGIAIAVSWNNLTESTYSPPREPKPYISNPSSSAPEFLDMLKNEAAPKGTYGDLLAEIDKKPKPSAYERPLNAPNGEAWPTVAAYVRGYEKLHTNGLSSVTVDNTQNDSNVFVKLVSLEGAEAYPVRQFYIPAHSKFTVKQVKAGGYDVRYRDLNSGRLFRSESFTLEETEIQGGTQFSNYTMTLYKVRNGNMQTYGLSEAEF